MTSFFKPMKDSAYQAHKAVCDREKAMLTPLKNAEKVVKKAMGDFSGEVEYQPVVDFDAMAFKRPVIPFELHSAQLRVDLG